MAVTDNGINELQKFIRNETALHPDYITIGSDTDVITGVETISDIGSEFLRKAVTWTQTGNYSKYLVQLASTDANGSYINRIGLITGSDFGSDILWTLNESIVGEKNASFNVQIEGEIIITR